MEEHVRMLRSLFIATVAVMGLSAIPVTSAEAHPGWWGSCYRWSPYQHRRVYYRCWYRHHHYWRHWRHHRYERSEYYPDYYYPGYSSYYPTYYYPTYYPSYRAYPTAWPSIGFNIGFGPHRHFGHHHHRH